MKNVELESKIQNPKSKINLSVTLAFASIYLIWGSTYLAILIAIQTMPPFLMAGVRFLIAGVILYAWVLLTGIRTGTRPKPTLLNWRGAAIIGGLLLLGGNGGVVYAEQLIPSGVAALLVSIIPLWIVLIDWARPGGVRPNARVWVGLALGIIGIIMLIGPGEIAGEGGVNLFGVLAILISTFCWATGTVFTRFAGLPSSGLLSTAMQMLAGGALLILASLVAGEWQSFNPADISLASMGALLYLIVFGSLIAFSAYVWLLKVSTPARVGTYAYVNPLVAVFLGWAFVGEPLSVRTLIAAAIIIGAVVIINTTRMQTTVSSKENKEDKEDKEEAQMSENKQKTNVPTLKDQGGIFQMDQLLTDREQSQRAYLEFLRVPSMSAGIYTLKAGATDKQQPHTEDEVYYVVSGRAHFTLDGEEMAVQAGSVIYVKAHIEHRFHTITEDLSTLVFFAPSEYALEVKTEEKIAVEV